MMAATAVRRGRASAVIPARLGFEDVTRRFETIDVLNGVSLEVNEAEVMCLLGQSGCGKSTLLRIAAGVETTTSGRVVMDGKEVAGPTRFVPPEQRGVGLVFQDYALFPHLSVMGNVTFGLHHLKRAEAEAVAMNALARVGLADMRAAFPHMLSGGEQQRVALARAVVPRPRVLLMDEPFSNLDRRMRDSVREDTVGLLRETGATAIIVTHDPEEAMRVADRIALMRAGKIVQVGTAEALYRHPADLRVARFFCDMNEVEAPVVNGEAISPLGRFDARHLGAATRAVICIRPQAVQIARTGEGALGRLLERRFLGEVHFAEVAVEGLETSLRARLWQAPAADVGDDVLICIDRQQVLVFEAVDA
jgi:iron(III) transport system ATP-binding protein